MDTRFTQMDLIVLINFCKRSIKYPARKPHGLSGADESPLRQRGSDITSPSKLAVADLNGCTKGRVGF
jgi:hypothetical protein